MWRALGQILCAWLKEYSCGAVGWSVGWLTQTMPRDDLSSMSLKCSGGSCDSLLLFYGTFWSISTGFITQ